MQDRIAFVFPGQGSHRADMASAWLPAAGELFDDLAEATGLDLPAVADDAEACGGSTRLGQPSITATSLAALAALDAAGVRPDVVAGHSMGEVAAAVAAGVFTATEGAAVVAARGRAMGQACRTTPGAMAAVVRLDVALVEQLVQDIDDVVVANLNSSQQAVIAGSPVAVEAAAVALRDAGARVLPLPVEGAFHSPAMTPAVVALTMALRWAPRREPQVPIVSGLDGRRLTSADEVHRALVEGVLAPVRWVDVQAALLDEGVGLVIEVGPGAVLCGLAKRSMPGVQVVSVAAPDDVHAAVTAVAALRTRTPVHA